MSDTPEKLDNPTSKAPVPANPETVNPETAVSNTAVPESAAQAGPIQRGPGGPVRDRGRGPGDRGRGPGGRDRFPRRKTQEAVPNLPEPVRPAGPNLRDLDAEIAEELEAAMGGLQAQNWMGVESSARVQQQKSGAGEGTQRKKGKVISIHGKDVFIDIPGGRSQGVLAREQFPDGPPEIGAEVECEIEGYDPANGLLILTRKGAPVAADWSTIAEGMIVEARVLETNKGGLSVDVNGIRGFMPISQIDLYRIESTEQFVNQRLLCVVTEANQSERNLVVSRRALLEKEREEKREKLWAELAEGQVREGVIRNVRDFGAFVDLGGVDGLLPLGEMSWQRVNDPNKLVQVGQTVKVVVLRLDQEARKVLLGLRQLEKNPWDEIQDRYPVGTVIQGRVTRTMDFGAFVELEPGIEGLIHVSELSRQRIWRVTDVVKPEQEVEAKVLSIDPAQKRISLSLRAMIPVEKPKTEEEKQEEEAEEISKKVKTPKPRTEPLKGGIGGGGPLFSLGGEEPK